MAKNKLTRWDGPSKSEQYLASRSDVPQVSALMAKSVSQFRRDGISNEVNQGFFRDGSGPSASEDGSTVNGRVVSSVGQNKFAQVVSSSGGNYRGGNGDTVKQSPEVYSPLWLNSNLNLPRDRATINAWCRSFYALNPFVHNAINLHSTYPISKLNITCPNKEIERFFNDMIEEIDLMNVCVQIAQEYWLLGESFVYSELDESRGKWSRLLIQNPDYMIVKRTVVANEPIIMLRPDENLKKIIFSNRPNDIEQRKQLNSHIINSVKRGENIPLDNFHVSHLARRISPYEIRGTGLPVCIFRQLMLFDKLRECYSADTEVLTNQGFKKITDLLQVSNTANHKLARIKLALVDDNNQVNYDYPENLSIEQYSGQIFSVTGKKVDLAVLPTSWLDVAKNDNNFQKVKASSLLEKKSYYQFNSQVQFNNTDHPASVVVNGKHIPTELYLKVLGYLVSEGCIYANDQNNRHDASISVSQLTSSDCYQEMKESFDAFAQLLNKKANHTVKVIGSGYSAHTPKEKWQVVIHGKDLVDHFKKEIGTNHNTLSAHKCLPRWVLNLTPELMNILLQALVKGDGTERVTNKSTSFKYSTISKQLADDVYELAFKLGFVPNLCISTATKTNNKSVTEYIVMWSTTEYGNHPYVYSFDQKNKFGGATIALNEYTGKLWNIATNKKIISRRNGKITVQYANSYDEHTEILTEEGFKYLHQLEKDNYVNGIIVNEDQSLSLLTLQDDIKIACVNPKTQAMEYHTPIEMHMSHYDGDMIHFQGKKVDCLVTPNHKMWVNPIINNQEMGYTKIPAQELSVGHSYKFNNIIDWTGNNIESVTVIDKQVPIDIYLKFIGNVISEGCVDSSLNKKTNQHRNRVVVTQLTQSLYYPNMRENIENFAQIFDKKVSTSIKVKGGGFSAHCPKEQWSGTIYYNLLNKYLIETIGMDGKCDSKNKRIPRFVLDLSPDKLQIILEALLDGDGSRKKLNNSQSSYKYSTASKQLADDVYELVYKLGYVPILQSFKRKTCTEYVIRWSDTNKGLTPKINGSGKNQKGASFNKVNYHGLVWCFEVPTGLFVTRRNGKVTVQGNSKYAQADNMVNPLTLVKIGTDAADGLHPTFADLEAWRNVFEQAQYDKDFKIFTHSGVAVDRVGYGQGIYDISGDITQIIKEIYVGLQVPPVLMDGGADTTYANGSVALDVLKQRYMQFRNMLSTWLKRKIFAPISKIQGFYDYSHGEKQLIVPEVDWNHMALFDAGDYIQTLLTLTQGEGDAKRASLHTLYRSLGLEFEDEIRKMRKESIQSAIAVKEKESLAAMDLNALRALDEEDEIPEIEKDPNDPSSGESALPGQDAGGGLPGLEKGSGEEPPVPPPPGA